MGRLRRDIAIHHGVTRDTRLSVAPRRARLETAERSDGELETDGVSCARRSVGLVLRRRLRRPMDILRRRFAVLLSCPVWMPLWRGAARILSGHSTSASLAVSWRWLQALQAN